MCLVLYGIYFVLPVQAQSPGQFRISNPQVVMSTPDGTSNSLRERIGKDHMDSFLAHGSYLERTDTRLESKLSSTLLELDEGQRTHEQIRIQAATTGESSEYIVIAKGRGLQKTIRYEALTTLSQQRATSTIKLIIPAHLRDLHAFLGTIVISVGSY